MQPYLVFRKQILQKRFIGLCWTEQTVRRYHPTFQPSRKQGNMKCWSLFVVSPTVCVNTQFCGIEIFDYFLWKLIIFFERWDSLHPLVTQVFSMTPLQYYHLSPFYPPFTQMQLWHILDKNAIYCTTVAAGEVKLQVQAAI